MKTGMLVLSGVFTAAAAAWVYHDAMLNVLSQNDQKQLTATLPDGGIVSIVPTEGKNKEGRNQTTLFQLKKGSESWSVAMNKGLPADYFVGTPYTPPYIAQNYNAAVTKVCELLGNYQTPAQSLWVSKGAQQYMAQLGRAAKDTYKRECV